jgi:hypothetical protein
MHIRARDRNYGSAFSMIYPIPRPVKQPRHRLRRNLVVEEANAIETVDQRAQMLLDPFRTRILGLLREYVDARIEFASERDEQGLQASTARAKQLQSQMWQEDVALVGQYANLRISPIFAQSLGILADLSEERLTAYERRILGTIWFVLILISVLTCFVVGYSMGRRLFLAMFVLPLTVAIVFSLVLVLDNPRTGFIRIEQQSMQRLQLDLRTNAVPNSNQ